MPQFDAIVVGAGPAGLAAAVRLSGAGRRVLLLEEDIMPGRGSIIRGRFEFDGGPWCWCAPALTAKDGQAVWQKLNAEHRLGLTVWLPVDGGRLAGRPGREPKLELTLPGGRGPLAAALAAYAPAKGWKQFWQLVDEAGAAMRQLAAGADAVRVESNCPGLRRAGAYELTQVCQALRLPEQATASLTVLSPLICGRSGEVLFGHFAAQLYQYAAGGLSRPREGWYALALALQERLRKLGGETRLGCPVTALRLAEDGVELETLSGPVSASVLLWAADDGPLFSGRLEEGLKARYPKAAALRAARCGGRLFSCRLGLACTGPELGLSSALSLEGGAGDGGALLAQVSPGEDEDSRCLLLTASVSDDWWDRVSGEEAAARGDRLARSYLARLSAALGRDIEPYIEEMDIQVGQQPWLAAGPALADGPVSRLLLPEDKLGERLFLCGPGQCPGWGPEAELALGDSAAARVLKEGEKLWPSA